MRLYLTHVSPEIVPGLPLGRNILGLGLVQPHEGLKKLTGNILRKEYLNSTVRTEI